MRRPRNDEIAASLEKVADLLEAQHASIYRVRAYRAAARTLRGLETSISDLVGGEEADGLESLPGIGKSIAAALREIVTTGRLRQLERLEGQASPQELFSTIPGIGGELARRIESQLHIESLEDLEAAAHDGRLEMDRIYRELSAQDKLRKIAPRRFNPEHRTWLPVLHRERAGWSLTAMYSNTARAHQLGRTHDWVVIYYERDGVDGQCTVVPEYSGALEGKRVVRGREAECAQHYALASSSASAETAVVGESC